MNQSQLDRAVARATGESLSTIRQMGFSAVVGEPTEQYRDPLVVDWDSLDAQHRCGFTHDLRQQVAA